MLQSGVLALGAFLVIRGEATAGVIIAGSILSARALAPVDLAITNWRAFVGARQSLQRLRKLLGLMPAATGAMALPKPHRSASLEGVSIIPPGSQKAVVQDVSFRLESGAGLGILGVSGSGKSTLARALVGVWQPMRGRITIDGATLEQWPADVLAREIGYLPQNVELLGGTVAENISRFEPGADASAIVAAAQVAGVHDLIVSLENGYATQVGEHGGVLSAGQAQRIALARALYGDPFLVVLDEPNSNLDAEGDAALTRAVRAVRERGGIVVVVAHRPSAIAGVDQILVMNKGRVQNFGPKEEVLSRVLQREAPQPSRTLKVVPDKSAHP